MYPSSTGEGGDELLELRWVFSHLTLQAKEEEEEEEDEGPLLLTFEAFTQRCTEIKMMLVAGDLDESLLETLWVETSARPGTTTTTTTTTTDSVCLLPALNFHGFLSLLSLCEERAPIAAGHRHFLGSDDRPTALNTLRGRLLGHLRATLIVSARRAHEAATERRRASQGGLGEISTAEAMELERCMKTANLAAGLASRESPETLRERNVLRHATPEGFALEHALCAASLKRGLDQQSDLDALREAGIFQTPMEATRRALDHALCAASLNRAMANRSAIEELNDAGIHVGDGVARRLERNIVSDKLGRGLAKQPDVDELKERGIYEESLSGTGGDTRSGLDHGLRRMLLGANLEGGQCSDGVEKLRREGIYRNLMDQRKREFEYRLHASMLSRALGSKSRPTWEDLQASGIARSRDGHKLERSLHRAMLNRALRGCVDLQSVKDRGIWKSDAQGRGERLEKALHADRVKHSLESRPPPKQLKQDGILHDPPLDAARQGLQFQLTRAILGRALRRGCAGEAELRTSGILQDRLTGGVGRSLELELIRNHLNRALANRPDREDLEEMGLIAAEELSAAYVSLAHRGARVSLDALLDWDEIRDMLDKDPPLLRRDDLEAAFQRSAALVASDDGDDATRTAADGLSFSQFLRFLSLVVVNLGPPKHEDDPSRHQRSCCDAVATSNAGLGGRRSLKMVLLAKIRIAGVMREEAELAEEHSCEVIDRLNRSLGAARPSREELEARGILRGDNVSVGGRDVARALDRQLRSRPELAQLKTRGIYHDAAVRLQLERNLIASALSRALTRRKEFVNVERDGYFEVDDLAEVFKELVASPENAGDDDDTTLLIEGEDTITFGALLAAPSVLQALESGSHTENELRETWRRAVVDADTSLDTIVNNEVGRLNFAGFLHLVESDLKHLWPTGGDDDGDGDDKEAKYDGSNDDRGQRLRRKRDRAVRHTIGRVLLTRLRARQVVSESDDLKRLTKAGHSEAAVLLQRNLVTNRIKHQLTIRQELSSLRAMGIYRDTKQPVAAMLEMNVISDRLKRLLGDRPELEELRERHIFQDSMQNIGHELERRLHSSFIERRLAARPSVEQLKLRGIFRDTTPVAAALEHSMRTAMLSRALDGRVDGKTLRERGTLRTPEEVAELQAGQERNAQAVEARLCSKPALSTLQESGIHKPAGAPAGPVSDGALSASLNEQISRRPDVDSLKNSGVFVSPRRATRKLAERNLNSARLGRALSERPEVGALRQSGIYHSPTSTIAKQLEFRLVASQVDANLSGRASIADLKAAGIFRENGGINHVVEHGLTRSLLLRALEGRSSHEELRAAGLYNDKSWASIELSRNLTASMLLRALDRRRTVEELEAAGIMISREQTPLQLQLERQLIKCQLNRALNQRPTKTEVEKAGLMKLDDLAIAFGELVCSSADEEGRHDELISFAQLRDWDEVNEVLESGHVTEDNLARCFNQLDTDEDGLLNFSGFLRFLQLSDLEPTYSVVADCEVMQSVFADAVAADGGASGGGAPTLLSFAGALAIREVRRFSNNLQRDVVCRHWADALRQSPGSSAPAAAGDTGARADFDAFLMFLGLLEEEHLEHLEVVQMTNPPSQPLLPLKQLLLRKLRNRPDADELRVRSILQAHGSPAAALLERNLIANSLRLFLASRPSIDSLRERGIMLPPTTEDERQETEAVLVKMLERQADGEMVSRLVDMNVIRSAGDHTTLEHHVAAKQLGRKLELRRNLSELQSAGIFPDSSIGVLDGTYVVLLESVLKVTNGIKTKMADLI